MIYLASLKSPLRLSLRSIVLMNEKQAARKKNSKTRFNPVYGNKRSLFKAIFTRNPAIKNHSIVLNSAGAIDIKKGRAIIAQ